MNIKFDEEKFKALKLDKTISEEVKIIITLFISNVRDQKSKLKIATGHDGAKGHLLEELFGLKKNKNTAADFGQIELKIGSPKTTLGDWSPDLGQYDIGKLVTKDNRKNKKQYLEDYGRMNEGKFHVTGPFYYDQVHERTNLKLLIKNNNLYLYDTKKDIEVIGWSNSLLTKNVSTKFKFGIAVVKTKKEIFTDLDFYIGFSIDKFFELIKSQEIIYDPGTSLKRPYSQFRFRRGLGSLQHVNYRYFLKE